MPPSVKTPLRDLEEHVSKLLQHLDWTAGDAAHAARFHWKLDGNRDHTPEWTPGDMPQDRLSVPDITDHILGRALAGSTLALKAWVLSLMCICSSNIEIERRRNLSRDKFGWHGKDRAIAEAEGWGVFDADAGLRVQRIDTMEIFEDDDEAIEHVSKQASRGCAMATKAIILVMSENLKDGSQMPVSYIQAQHIVAAHALHDALKLAIAVGLVDLLKPPAGQTGSFADVYDTVSQFTTNQPLPR